MPGRYVRNGQLWPVIIFWFSLLAACGETRPEVALTLATTAAATPEPAVTATPPPASPTVSSAPLLALSEVTSTPAVFNRAPTAPVAGLATAAPARTTAAPQPTATPRPAIPAATGFQGKLSVIGPEKALYILRFDGKGPQLVLGTAGVRAGRNQDGIIYDWPTWSGDGSKLAVMGFKVKNGNIESSEVVVVDGDGKNPVKIQDTSTASPVFMAWSPDGRQLSLLVSGGSNRLELNLLDTGQNLAAAASTIRKVAEGNAIYSGWSPDSQQLLVHASSPTTNTLASLAARDNKAGPVAIPANPGAFRSPAFSSDGSRYAFAVKNRQSGQEDITLHDKSGALSGSIETGGNGVAFNWSPGALRLAFSTLLPDGQGFYKGISLYEQTTPAAAGARLTANSIANEPVAAFFWSPDGKKLAFVGFNEDGNLLMWKIYDVDTRKTTELNEWYPSDNWIQMMQYFDQYAQANSVWSPDSKALVFGGYTKEDVRNIRGQSGSEENVAPTVYVVPVEGPEAGKPRPVANGGLAFWSR